MLSLDIVIPTYNYAHNLECAILSALACSDDDIDLKVIVVDDGSTDNTKEVIEHLQTAKHPFTYIYQKNSGPAAARNRGIDNSKAEFLIFLDADDELCPTGVKQGLREISRHSDLGFIVAGHNSISGNNIKYVSPGRISASCEVNFRRYLLDKKIKMSNGSMIIRKTSLADIRFPEALRNSEDIPVFAQLLAKFQASSIDVALVNINKHDDSLRHNMAYASEVGERVVDYLFSVITLPPWTQKYESNYRAQRLLSLFRSYYLAGDKDMARAHYIKAISKKPLMLFKFSYLKKFIKIIF